MSVRNSPNISELKASATDDQPPAVNYSKVVRILSIDGGGIRGIIPAKVLSDLEADLKLEFKRDICISECFDIIAGTSTGGIIALGLTLPADKDPTKPKYPASKAVALYEEGQGIFPPTKGWSLFSSKFNVKPLEDKLNEYFEEHTLKEAVKRVLITAYDLKSSKLMVLDSVEAQDDRNNFKTKDVARATSAAPTFFKAGEIKSISNDKYTFLDGGVSANNPAFLAFQKAQEVYPNAADYFIVSLGTGKAKRPNLSEDLKNGGRLTWAPQIASLMMDSASKLVHESMSNYAKLAKHQTGLFKYVRIQVDLNKKNKDMTDTSDINMDTLLTEGREVKKTPEYANVLTFLKEYFKSLGDQKDEDPHLRELTLKILTAPKESLALINAGVRSTDLDHIALKLKGKPSIQTLDLSSNELTHEAMPTLINMISDFKVVDLVLNGNTNIGDTGIKRFTKLFQGKAKEKKEIFLKRLSLKKTGITDAGVQAIGEWMLVTPNVTFILTENDIGPATQELFKGQEHIVFKNNKKPEEKKKHKKKRSDHTQLAATAAVSSGPVSESKHKSKSKQKQTDDSGDTKKKDVH